MEPAPLLPITLLAVGQRLHLAVDAGTVLVALQGRLRVDETQRWLADTLLPTGALVGEGQAYVVQQSGWLSVTATGPVDARLSLQAPAGRLARLAQTLRQRLGRGRAAACGA